MNSKTLLVTGAAGFIGSHTVIELVSAGFNVIGIDNFCNSDPNVVEKLQKLKSDIPNTTNLELIIIDIDVRNQTKLNQIFREHSIDGVVHFAGLKSVGESNDLPLNYWDNNVGGTISLLNVMNCFGTKNFVFSSSATVYGVAKQLPIKEDADTTVTNTYGRTKLVCEELLSDFSKANPEWNISLLRYFNPVGAHPSGYIGEMPNGIPNNLMPFLTQVAAGLREKLSIFGADYDTPDGTCIRDYIHVVDLAKGHVAALVAMLSDKLNNSQNSLSSSIENSMNGLQVLNFGTGRGISVKELVNTFSKVTGINVKYEFVGRRVGDVPVLYADASKAEKLLGWRAEKTLEEMCEDAWRWQSNLSRLG